MELVQSCFFLTSNFLESPNHERDSGFLFLGKESGSARTPTADRIINDEGACLEGYLINSGTVHPSVVGEQTYNNGVACAS